MTQPTALVTGASRGIGKACAVELAKAGFDVAILARTVQEGEQREHSSTLKSSDTSPLPGSLTSTAALVRDAGREALVLQGDLLDRASLGAAAATLLERWGRIDVIVHNARYIGPGHMDRFLDTPIALLDAHLQANVLATLVLNQLLLPTMIGQGGGTVVNITSASGYADPSAPAGEGGWGMGYGISKGAMQRIAGFLAVELGPQGVQAFNVQPGFVATERIAQDMAKFGFDASAGAPAEVIGVVVAWLATQAEAAELNGTTIEAQYFAHERALLPDWGGPVPGQSINYEMAGANLAALEARYAALAAEGGTAAR
jgi:NAD(P)-dependent dehydrogenase (short-subunit alcohol dehydrogenase family)